jgi:putative addiction module killer protein
LEAHERNIQYYLPLPAGSPAPFGQWLDGILDRRLRAAIVARIARLRGGNFSDSKPIGEGAIESRIDFGPGYRIYYGMDGDDVILLYGGEKSTQSSDIEMARKFWKDYEERTKKNAKKSRLQDRSPRRPSR